MRLSISTLRMMLMFGDKEATGVFNRVIAKIRIGDPWTTDTKVFYKKWFGEDEDGPQ